MAGVIIHDDRQQRWYVTEDDPAWKLVSTLIRLGYRKIELPTMSIRIGSVPNLGRMAEDMVPLVEAYEKIEASSSDPKLLNSMGVALAQLSTLWDCCLALQNEVY
ncbi:hypothetical protein LCGC14_0310860 [marine sediment metagenome]|uniref:Uncharacterized protein n=1 Tax=marine sediment metagenome TaxID=412755 RepID=A0A0F9WTX0_9ZZZZ